MREQRLLDGGRAAVDLSHHGVVRISGPDRLSWLHSLLSQDVAGLVDGTAADACVLTPKGRLVGVPVVLRVGDAHWLDLDAETVLDVVARLERTVITEDVTFRDRGAETW